MLPFMLTSCLLTAPLADADSLADVACVSNYLFAVDPNDVAAWTRDLDDMRRAGFGTVWVVNVWAQFQPSVLSPRYDQESIDALRAICRAAGERGMKVLLVVAYIGEGWGPKGVDVPVWPLVDSHRRQHLRFLARMARETAEFDNVFYLLCSEEILPATVLYQPSQRSECAEAFREWARAENADVGHWNERWGTDFTWETFHPLDTTDRKRYEAWVDHNRWFGHLMRELLPPMAEAIRREKPGALIGFHDFLIDPVLKPGRADLGMPAEGVIDFASIGYYVDKAISNEENLAKLKERVKLCRAAYPEMPTFVGEIGMAVDITSDDARTADEQRAAQWFGMALPYLRSEGIGYSVWCWRTVVPGAKESFSLIREDGTRTPMLDTIAAVNRRRP